MPESAALRARLDDVRERIARAAGRAGRDPASIRLIAVSKTVPADDVRALAAAGQVDFGENKVQEALQKMAETADVQIRWHLVGHLQSNKAAKAAVHFHAIHSVDSARLVRAIDEAAARAGREVDLLVQVDLAHEPTKHGVSEQDLAPLFETGRACRAARLVGLMLLPPAAGNPEEARPYFRRLRDVQARLRQEGVDAAMVRELSMGMSHDFEAAIEEGATMVRVGTAIFGERASR